MRRPCNVCGTERVPKEGGLFLELFYTAAASFCLV